MIEITPSIVLDDSEVHFAFIRSSGPGGQNINKVSTSVQLRFDVRGSSSLAMDVKERLEKLAGNRMSDDGILTIEAKRFRTQEQNRFDATQRLIELIQKALVKPKVRRPTRPGPRVSGARIDEKKRWGQIKRMRRFDPDDWE